MTIIRATNNCTGEIFEINSESFPELNNCVTGLQAMRIAIAIFGFIFESTDADFDALEVEVQ